MKNLGFEFNKKIFWNLYNEKQYNSDNIFLKSEIVKINYANIEDGIKLINEGQADCIETFEIAYPGLYCGLGYTHDTGKSEEEFKTGFSFDYTTGVPYIPASSLKGILRSHFPARYTNKEKKKEVIDSLQKILIELFQADNINISLLELEIFGPADESDEKSNPADRTRFGIGIPSTRNTLNQLLFSIDTITPHDHPLKEPTPLRTLALTPGLLIDIHMDIKETTELKVHQLKSLFIFLIKNYGLGAKTNSGYGQFVNENNSNIINDNDGYLSFLDEPIAPVKKENYRDNSYTNKNNRVEIDYKSKVNNNLNNTPVTISSIKELKTNCYINATVISNKNDKIICTFILNNDIERQAMTNTYRSALNFNIGQQVVIKIKNIEGKFPNIKNIIIESLTK